MNRVGVWSWVGLVTLFFGWNSLPIARAAQDDPPPKKAAADSKRPQDPNQVLADLIAKTEAIGKKLQKLQQDYQKAKPEERKKISDEFDLLRGELQKELFPQMVKVALPLYLKDDKNKEAEEVVLGHLHALYTENKYDEVIATWEKLSAAGRKSPVLLNLAGVAYFATQQFDKAKTILEEAQEAGGPAFDQLGARYLDEIPNYLKYWKKEQEIRAREAAAPEAEKLPHVVFKTTKGDIEFELFENQAPNTVANFISLVEKKKYDGIAFHRVLPNFMAQGGDPNTLDDDPANDGQGGPGYTIECECYRPDARMHFQGSLSMAHAGKDTGGSQFFITHLPTSHLNPDAKIERGHTVFGRVVKGMLVAASLQAKDKIISAKVLNKRNHKYEPVTTKAR
jgi:cyclophilin family peptidyl-prolyl cis-trans isomerase